MKYLFVVLGLASTALAERIDVRADGSGNALQRAMLAAAPGDTLVVGPGYFHGFFIPAETNNLTIIGAGPEKSTIGGAPYTAIRCRGARGISIEGFLISPNTDIIGTSGVSVDDCGITFRRNVIQGYRSINCFGDSFIKAHFNAFESTWAAIELHGMPNDVDARFNWWGTADREEILNRIVDGREDAGKGIVDFEMWLLAPEGIETHIQPFSWGTLKGGQNW